MKARIIFEYKDEKIQEILKENDITSADELKEFLKYKLNNDDTICCELEDGIIDVDYGNHSPMLEKKCNIPDTINLIDKLEKDLVIKTLEKKVAELEVDNTKLKEKNEELMNQPSVSEFEAKIKDLEKEIKNLKEAVEVKQTCIDSWKKYGTERNEIIASRNEDIKKLKNTIGVANTTCESLHKEIKELQKQNNELMDKIELLEDTPVECSTCGTYSHYVKADAENKKLKEEIKSYELAATMMCAKYNTLNDKYAEVQYENEKLKEENETLSIQYCDCESKIKALKQENENLKISNKGFYNGFVQDRKEIEELKKKNKELQEKYDQVLDFNDNLHDGNAELYKQNENLMKDIEDLKKRNEELRQELLDIHSVNLKLREVEHKLGRKTAYTHIINKLEDGCYYISNPIYNDSPKKKYTRDEVDKTVNEVLLTYNKGLREYVQSEIDAIK